MSRQFKDEAAKRERVPMLVGLTGASGSGKTYSALRLASGMQRVTGGDIFYIDTESRRALHYADKFDFRHVEMNEPFSPLDYLAAIEYCAAKKASIIIIDSMSHEHEGPGGVLEMHDQALDKMAGKTDWKKRNQMTFAAWAKPKAERRKLINAVLRMGVNAVFCFRAKEKIKISKINGKNEMIQMGWMPIAGEEFVFEMTINCLLYPGSGGIPTWAPDEPGEKIMLKRPANLASVFEDGKPLSEETGEGLAKWAQGDVSKPVSDGEPRDELIDLVFDLKSAKTKDDLDSLMNAAADREWSKDEKRALREIIETRRTELAAA